MRARRGGVALKVSVAGCNIQVELRPTTVRGVSTAPDILNTGKVSNAFLSFSEAFVHIEV